MIVAGDGLNMDEETRQNKHYLSKLLAKYINKSLENYQIWGGQTVKVWV